MTTETEIGVLCGKYLWKIHNLSYVRTSSFLPLFTFSLLHTNMHSKLLQESDVQHTCIAIPVDDNMYGIIDSEWMEMGKNLKLSYSCL